MQRKLHLRTKIFFIVLVAIIPTVAISVFSALSFQRSYIKDQQDAITKLCDGFSNEQRLIVGNAEEMLLAVSQTRSVLDEDYGYLNVYLHDLMAIYPDYAVLLVANSDGVVVASGVNKIGYSIADRDYFKTAKQTGFFTVGSYVVSRSTGLPVMPFVLPVNNRKGGQVFLICTFSLEKYNKELSLNRLPNGFLLEVFDNEGGRLFTSDSSLKDSDGKQVSGDLYRWATGNRSRAEVVSLEGIRYLVSSDMHIRNNRAIYTTVRAQYDKIFFESIKPAIRIICLMLLACLAAFLLSLWLARRLFVVRIERLTAYTKAVASGETGVRSIPNKALDEISDLMVSFNQMAETIEERNLSNQKAIAEKEILLAELKKRISDNLQLLSSLVNLQIEHTTSDDIRRVLMTTHSRVMALSLVYEMIYRYSDFQLVSMQLYCNGLCDFLLSLYADVGSDITCQVSGIELSLPVEKALPLALILNELVSNSILHAFPDGKKGSIEIVFSSDHDSSCRMSIIDNGIGISEDIHKNDTLGYEMIEALVEQIGGTLSVRSEDAGTSVCVVFPGV